MLCNALFAQRNEAKKRPHERQMRFDCAQASLLGHLRLSSHQPTCRLLVKKAHRAFYLHSPLWTPAPVFLKFNLWRKIFHKNSALARIPRRSISLCELPSVFLIFILPPAGSNMPLHICPHQGKRIMRNVVKMWVHSSLQGEEETPLLKLLN